MSDQSLSYEAARRNLKSMPASRWRDIQDAFAGEVWPVLHPSFKLQPGDCIFTIGSCFARNIEEHLARLGCRLPMLDFRLPPEEWHGSPNGAMNKFTPPSFRQCLEWTAAIFDRDGRVAWEDCERLAFDCGGDLWHDLDMGRTGPVTRARLIERRQHIYDIFSQVFSADCLMMTPGLIEAWRDLETGLYVHEGPTAREMLPHAARFEVEVLSFEQSLADMLAAVDVVRARNPQVKILVTTSPVPFAATFTGQDVRTANTYSKSLLRTVCGALTMRRERLDYFPSYESVTLSFPEGVWQADRIHVTSGFVGKIVSHLIDAYVEGVDEGARAYQLAGAALAAGAMEDAERYARTALEARPEAVGPRLVLADVLAARRAFAEAEAELRRLHEAEPGRADILVRLARALAQLGSQRRAEAIACVEQAAELESAEVQDFSWACDFTLSHAPIEVAEKLARRAMGRFPNHVQTYPPVAAVLAASGRRGEAIEVLQKATGLPKPPAALFARLAELLAEDGRDAEAVQAARMARNMDAGNAAAGAVLARLDPSA
jgi:tetratricopeptide (TPR) repeat protein